MSVLTAKRDKPRVAVLPRIHFLPVEERREGKVSHPQRRRAVWSTHRIIQLVLGHIKLIQFVLHRADSVSTRLRTVPPRRRQLGRVRVGARIGEKAQRRWIVRWPSSSRRRRGASGRHGFERLRERERDGDSVWTGVCESERCRMTRLSTSEPRKSLPVLRTA